MDDPRILCLTERPQEPAGECALTVGRIRCISWRKSTNGSRWQLTLDTMTMMMPARVQVPLVMMTIAMAAIPSKHLYVRSALKKMCAVNSGLPCLHVSMECARRALQGLLPLALQCSTAHFARRK